MAFHPSPSHAAPPRSGASSPRGKEVLLLCHRVPYPPDKGDKIRSFHLLRHLVRTGWNVHLGALVDDPDDLAHVPALSRLCKSLCLEITDSWSARIGALRGLASGLPLSVGHFSNKALAKWCAGIVSGGALDAALCVSAPMAQYLRNVPEGARPPRIVVDLVDVDSRKWAEFSRRVRGPMRWVYRLEHRLLSSYEAGLARWADAVAVVSRPEAEVYRGLAGTPAHVVGNGVDLDYFRPAPEVEEEPGLMVFCGRMDYLPNEDAVEWFAREAFPRIRARHGEARFLIVGAKPSARVRALSAISGVSVSGRLDDVRPSVWRAALSVAPIRLARGVQNKVLEAMAMGKAVLVTPAAFEGLEGTTDADLALCPPDPERFAREACLLLENPGLRRSMGLRARTLVERRYAWDQCFAEWGRLLAPKKPCGENHAPVSGRN